MLSSTLPHPVQHLRTYLATLLNLSPADIYYHLIETLFLFLILYLALTRAYKPWSQKSHPPNLSKRQISQNLLSWKPAPLAPPLTPAESALLPLDLLIHPNPSGTLTVNTRPDVLNFATSNFLGLLKHPAIESVCKDVMRTNGLGACGPRGFYGTTDVHMDCEDALAAFSGTDTAILYSFGAATGNSTIPAFCKRGDLVVADEAVSFGLQSGLALSRAEVRYFRHNDMEDLERVLQEVVAGDAKEPGKRNTQRRLIVVEGMYQNVGDVCPLDKVVALKEKFLFRVMVDESFSLGVLGRSGRGALEQFDVPREMVDIATADLGNAIASVGGFCVGNLEVVKHQRLSGAGYCFSASQPPFLAAAAAKAVQILQEEGVERTERLRENVKTFWDALDVEGLERGGWYVDGDRRSPLMHVRCRDEMLPVDTFTKVQEFCLEEGVLFARPVYAKAEARMPRPSLRVTVSTVHSREDLLKAADVLQRALKSAVLNS